MRSPGACVRSGELKQAGCAGTPRARESNVAAAITRRTGGNCLHWRQPETAMIIGSLWRMPCPAPGKSLKEIVISAPDGAVFRCADAGALSASGMKMATLQARSVSVTLDTPVVECTNLLRTATLDVTKGGKMSGNITHSGGNFTSNGITVHTHKHGVKGSDSTGGPVVTTRYTGMNPDGTGNLNDMEHLKQSVRYPDHPAGKPGYDGNMAALCLI